MMLWYKNLLETRSRVIFSFIIWTGFIIPTLWAIRSDLANSTDSEGVFFLAFVSFATFVSLAGSGVRTQAGYLAMMPNPKSTIYTLSLPVSRRRLLLMRSAIGLLEAIALTFIYTILVWILFFPEKAPGDFAGPFLAISFCGICIYFLAVFFSTFLSEVLFIWFVWVLLLLYLAPIAKGWMPAFLNVFNAMQPPFGTGTNPLPQMAVFLALGAIFLFASIKVIESQEY